MNAAPDPARRTATGPGLHDEPRSRVPGEDDDDPRPSSAAPGEWFRPASTWIAEPAPASVVEGLAWAGCVTVLAGESASGKTFVSLDLAGAVADGSLWHGRLTERGSVAYVAYESDALGLRLQALQAHGRRSLEGVYVLRGRDPLSPIVSRDGMELPSAGETYLAGRLERLAAELAAAGRPPLRLVVVDTIRASLSGSEDNSETASAYLRAIRRILAAVPGAAAILVHHAGWQDGEQAKRRERGSSAWRGNVDSTVYVEVVRDEDPAAVELILRALKARDAERSAPLRLIRRRVDGLGTDHYGRPLTSCIIEDDTRSKEDREAEARASQEAESRETDSRILGAVRDHPGGVTALAGFRALLGLRQELVSASVARCVARGWLLAPKRQRHPYSLTDAGVAVVGAVR